jgi:hypothetical protein
VFPKQIVSLTITRTRCSTFGHGPGLCRQERRATVGLGQASGRCASCMIVLHQGGSRTVPFGVHGGTAVAMLIISGLLLID